MLVVLQESRPGKYLSGDQLTYADLATFTQLSTLRSGWLEGELGLGVTLNIASVTCVLTNSPVPQRDI